MWRTSRGEGGGGRSGARDVADDERPASVGEGKDVVEVAADLDALTGRVEGRGQLDARNGGQLRGEQGGLQEGGDLNPFGVQPGVVDRDRGTAGQLARQFGLVDTERRPAAHAQEREHPQVLAAGHERLEDP